MQPSEAQPTHVALEHTLAGRTIAGRYELLEEIGSGAFGVVYRARHTGLDQDVAVKILFSDLLRMHPDVGRRFKREARAASMLQHRNTVSVLDFGEDDGLLYLAMEFIDGHTLFERVVEGDALELHELVDIGAQVLAALAAAHDQGIVHRDIKPENVILLPVRRDDGSPGCLAKVCDFGLAKIGARDKGDTRPSLTGRGEIFGTPAYMSPEQARGDALDPASDLYAVGALLYQLACGTVPFDAETPVGILMKHLTEPVPPMEERRRGVPPALEAVVRRALEKDATDRFADAREMRNALIAVLETSEADWRTAPQVVAAATISSARGSAARSTDTGGAPRRESGPRSTQAATTPPPGFGTTTDTPELVATTAAAARVSTSVEPVQSTWQTRALAVLVVIGVIAAVVIALTGAEQDPQPAEGPRVAETEPTTTPPPNDEPEPVVDDPVPAADARLAVPDRVPAGVASAQQLARAAVSAGLGALGARTVVVAESIGTEDSAENTDGRDDDASPEPATLDRTSRDRASERRAEARRDRARDRERAAAEAVDDGDDGDPEGAGSTDGNDADLGAVALAETDPTPPIPATPEDETDDTDVIPAPAERPDSVVDTAAVDPDPPSLSATATIQQVTIKGSMPRQVVARKLSRARSDFEACYRTAAKKAGRDWDVTLNVAFDVNVDGLVSNVRMTRKGSAGLRACVEDVVQAVRTDRPDTGTVLVGFKLGFTPR